MLSVVSTRSLRAIATAVPTVNFSSAGVPRRRYTYIPWYVTVRTVDCTESLSSTWITTANPMPAVGLSVRL